VYENASCTIYHKYYDPVEMTDDAIQRFFIPSCFWDSVNNVSKTTLGLEDADNGLIVINDISKYMTPKQWENATEAEKEGKWTIDVGDKIVKGEIPETVDFVDLEKSYDDVLNASSVDEKLFGSPRMQHIQVGAK